MEETNQRRNNGVISMTTPPLKQLALLLTLLGCCFWRPLSDLARFAAKEELYSHVFLVPFISGYLVWLRLPSLPKPSNRSGLTAGMFALLSLAPLAVLLGLRGTPVSLTRADTLCATTLSFLGFFLTAIVWTFGKEKTTALAFPLGFLLFMVPMPSVAMHGLELFLQHGSALVAAGAFRLASTPVLHEGLVFQLPGITIEVASECSGIRSSYVLLMTCLLAGHLFLRHPAHRLVLALAVIPLGIARNAFRVFVIALLCVYKGPHMIDSFIHRQGGPFFFLISLIPLFFLLFLLRHRENRRTSQPPLGKLIK